MYYALCAFERVVKVSQKGVSSPFLKHLGLRRVVVFCHLFPCPKFLRCAALKSFLYNHRTSCGGWWWVLLKTRKMEKRKEKGKTNLTKFIFFLFFSFFYLSWSLGSVGNDTRGSPSLFRVFCRIGRKQDNILGTKVLPWLLTNPRLGSTFGETGPFLNRWSMAST